MRQCLAFFRFGAYVIVFGVFVFIGVCCHLLFFTSLPRRLKWVSIFIQGWAQITCLVFNIQVKVEGAPHVKPGSLIVANHVGSPDIFILGAFFRGFFVSKSEISGWPLINWLARLGITIFADRSKRHQVKAVIQKIEERLNAKHSVILFPESQATDGTAIIPFKSAIFEAAVLAQRPVLPVLIRYHDGNQPTVAYYGNSFFKHILNLLKTPRLKATITILPEVSTCSTRQTLAEQSFRAIRDRFIDVSPHPV